ncbi:hypothetical protein [Asticcacaulis sp. YBE204]|nr:hypothetical protein [Asticcacaulis sp. YBE204]ESQ79398.1 hypothetical protein AEYBE204_10335 [Asticcacaulis sp. YBE204]
MKRDQILLVILIIAGAVLPMVSKPNPWWLLLAPAALGVWIGFKPR